MTGPVGKNAVVLDTNLFVAAGFNPHSASARIVDQVRGGDLRLVWNEGTRAETRAVLEKIPPLAWNDFADLFRRQDRFEGETRPDAFGHIPDATDRKFAALADAAGALLLTSDQDLLDSREGGRVPIFSPTEFQEQRRDSTPD